MQRDYTLSYIVDTSQAHGLDVIKTKLDEIKVATAQLTAQTNTCANAFSNLGNAASQNTGHIGNAAPVVQQTAKSFGGLVTEMLTAQTVMGGFTIALGVFQQLGEKANEVREKMKEMADETAKLRGEYR